MLLAELARSELGGIYAVACDASLECQVRLLERCASSNGDDTSS